jgi:phosphoribosyl-ATP pyrophosphohydrolase
VSFSLGDLAKTIAARAQASGEQSYTRALLDKGPGGAARKFGEEAVELVIAAVGQDEAAVRAEAADVLYHLLVVLKAREVPLDEVLAELERRTARSGLEEKASRRS